MNQRKRKPKLWVMKPITRSRTAALSSGKAISGTIAATTTISAGQKTCLSIGADFIRPTYRSFWKNSQITSIEN